MNQTGCTKNGVCGKKGETADLQDRLLYALKGYAFLDRKASLSGLGDPDAGPFLMKMLFSTLTNVNFDPAWFKDAISETVERRDAVRTRIHENGACGGNCHPPKEAVASYDEIMGNEPVHSGISEKIGVLSTADENIRSLRETLIYGLKGIGAYGYHAHVLGHEQKRIAEFIEKALCAAMDETLSADDLVALLLECGGIGVEVLSHLDDANTTAYGHPEPTKVSTGVRKNPGILISGHDLKDLEMLLEQTKGTGIDVYTHGEMLPAHAYPAFKKYDNLVANYGDAWHRQKSDFTKFNGTILMTTNCLVPPADEYKDRLWTTGVVGYPGIPSIGADENGYKDFSPLIEKAKTCGAPEELENGSVMTGFAQNAVLSAAGPIVEMIRSGTIRRFVVMAGCDGRRAERAYYTDFAAKLPQDVVILTAGCAKFRYNKLPLGNIGNTDLPRVLDAGQCNDCYSLAIIALELVRVFGLDHINDLPLSFNISWYEQKAVLVLLVLLHLGVKNIILGPTLPAFLSPGVVDVLVKTFNIGTISTVDADMEKILSA